MESTCKKSLLEVGMKAYLFCINYHFIGEVTEMTDGEIVIENAVWVGSAGKEEDSVQRIVEGKRRPASYERISKIVLLRDHLMHFIPLSPGWIMGEGRK